MNERLAELRELQDSITAQRRDDLIGKKMTVLIDEIGVARSHREAPEIDGVVHVSETLSVATFVEVEIADALGPDLVAVGASAEVNDEANELVDDAR
jgi:tRNA A37 methylthiotransferase MiaB